METNNRISLLRWRGIAVLLIYLGIRFPLEDHLDRLSPYASYLFEGFFVAFTAWVYRSQISLRVERTHRLAVDIAALLALGLLVFKATFWFSLVMPFDLRAIETILFLLVVGPILEELIFRMGLWGALSDMFRSPWAAVIGTALLFAFGHFFAFWYVPEPMRGFVVYQTIYAAVLGFYLGLRRWKTGSVTVPMILHACFNLGFWLGSLV